MPDHECPDGRDDCQVCEVESLRRRASELEDLLRVYRVHARRQRRIDRACGRRPLSEAFLVRDAEELIAADPTLGEFDRCERCNGTRECVPGNENVIDGIVLCDRCTADEIQERRADPPRTTVERAGAVIDRIIAGSRYEPEPNEPEPEAPTRSGALFHPSRGAR